MGCVFDAELDEIELAAALGGDAPPGVAAHLAACAHCAERAAALNDEEEWWAARLHRALCPSPAALQDFVFTLLPAAGEAAVAEHAASCPHCTRDLLSLHAFLAGGETAHRRAAASEPATPGPLARLRLRVGELLTGAGGLAFGARGAADSLLYRAGDIIVGVNVQADPARPGCLDIVGAAAGLPLGGSAFLWQDDRLAAAAPVDELGGFQFSGVDPAGPYDLEVTAPGAAVRLPDIQLTP